MKYDKTVVCHTVTTTSTTHEYMIQSADIAFSFVYVKYANRSYVARANVAGTDGANIKDIDTKKLREAVDLDFSDDVILYLMSVIFEKEVGR